MRRKYQCRALEGSERARSAAHCGTAHRGAEPATGSSQKILPPWDTCARRAARAPDVGERISGFGRIVVGDEAALAGTLAVEASALTPSVGQIFPVLTFARRSGTFGTFAGLGLGDGLVLSPTADATSVILTVVAE